MTFDDLFVYSQYISPQHLISRAAGKLAEATTPAIKNTFIKWFIDQYGVDMTEAQESNPEAYRNFNDFFTRALKEDARVVEQDLKTLVSPVDGAISQLGEIRQGQIFQAKGHSFSAVDLLGGKPERAEPFIGGNFATIYLSPKDYHRIHMPVTGTLREMVYIPGKLFSVNPATAANVPNLFARNERVAAIFDTEFGPMAMVLVGAMIVASIETSWAGLVAPMRKQVVDFSYKDSEEIVIEKGQEMGRFKLGSTVVMLLPENVGQFKQEFAAESPVKMGEAFADLK